jgi:3-methylcrotonyl-CoA carboxylase alpha subunit
VSGEGYEASIDGVRFPQGEDKSVSATLRADGVLTLAAGDLRRTCAVARRGHDVLVSWQGVTYSLAKPRPLDVESATHEREVVGGRQALAAPMAGTVIKVNVAEGEAVAAGQALVVLGAMKMEHAITSPYAGRVVRLTHQVGDVVPGGELLIELDTGSGTER